MRAVVQRVTRASVSVSGKVVGAIGRGLLVLVGVTHEDGDPEADALANKIAGLRVFPDDGGHLNRSVADVDGEVLVVSQFTLYGDVRRGRRPSFTEAAAPEQAAPLIDRLGAAIAGRGITVETGSFGAHMVVESVNDGPVTLVLEVAHGRVG
ncbi:MAG TPA: D-aminoacyl-tRNA deacylase [Acidimicrobiia bacterium]|nr:D-aminoacyl-tRNA deacylase [Acidimicrobiia bacterium]